MKMYVSVHITDCNLSKWLNTKQRNPGKSSEMVLTAYLLPKLLS